MLIPYFCGLMADIIRLLSDTVANQIAAGEVIQRPASAVKEMLENAVDAGARKIQLLLLDAGKTLIQVIDDGAGMTATDARLCFERHATSKLRKIDDLFTLHTMGFRGEALASIASVAQVELRTRRAESELGSAVVIEGGSFVRQEDTVVPAGTSLSVKNLFYNVPARRNFLKSNPVETRHIQEEFLRVALANPAVHFTMHHNETQVFDVRTGNFRQRIAGLFGAGYNERLVPVEEETSIVKIEGYIGKPEFARKNRGEQYFFVNNRFIRDSYLHHAVSAAFDALIPKDAYPSYWLKLYVDPALVDVNIHPTKTEIKFQHDKDIYQILRAAIKRALGKYSVAPSLDFDQEPAFDLPLSKLNEQPVPPRIQVNPNYNPFRQEEQPVPDGAGVLPRTASFGRSSASPAAVRAWIETHQATAVQQIMPGTVQPLPAEHPVVDLLMLVEELDDFRFVQTGPGVAMAAHSRGLLLFDVLAARERILYERFLHSFTRQHPHSQQQLFPPQITLSPADYALVTELTDDLKALGFDISPFGKHTIVVQGIPAGLESGTEQAILQQLLEQYRANKDKLQLPVHENLARSLSRSILQRAPRQYTSRELRQTAIDLLHCDQPFAGVNGKTILRTFRSEQISQLLQSNLL